MNKDTTNDNSVQMLDAVVLGTGFSGICMLHKLTNDLGLKAKAIDKAAGVGGTWYWNRYPGARVDTEGLAYSYSFDDKLYKDWNWSEKYPAQPEVLSYLEHVTDRYDLRKNMMFSTLVTKAHFNEQTDRWEVETNKGDRISAKFLVNGLGLLSAANTPSFSGDDKFKGQVYHTANWPEDPVDFKGKRVGVIGSGSTGIQVVVEVAKTAEKLTLLQRTPQYTVPMNNGDQDPEQIAEIKSDPTAYFDKLRDTATCFPFEEATRGAMEVSPEERERVYEDAWQKGGGFRFMFGTFNDIAVNTDSNDTAVEFLRRKITAAVKDPKKLAAVMPTQLYARRPLCDNHFYETVNQDNVDVINVGNSPIEEFTEKGIRTAEGEIELDIVIFATGFDAVTGNFVRIDFQGRDGVKMKDHWEHGPRAYLGLSAAGFPNMFSIYGPPGPFTNQPPAIEWQCQWVAEAIENLNSRNIASMEATPEAEQAWLDECIEIAESTLFAKIKWWVMGDNIPGKPRSVGFFMGGFGEYMKRAKECSENGYRGYKLSEG